MNHYLTFDYGTTSIKAGLIDAELKMLAQCIEEYDLITDGGRIEMNSEERDFSLGLMKMLCWMCWRRGRMSGSSFTVSDDSVSTRWVMDCASYCVMDDR